MGLLNFLKRKKEKPLFKGQVFDYHEDDFCMIELVPIESLSELKEDFDAINRIIKENKDHFGFTEIHVREEKKIRLIDRQILAHELEKILQESLLPKFDTVTTGYSSLQYESEFSTAFGVKSEHILIYERNKNFAEKIWFQLGFALEDEEYSIKFTEVVNLISKKWNLVLVNWYGPIVIDSRNLNNITNYLLKK